MNKIAQVLRETRALYIGDGKDQWDFGHIQQRFGLCAQHVEAGEFLARVAAYPEPEVAAELAGWRRSFAEVIEPSESDLMKATRVYCVLRDLLREHRATSLALCCGSLIRDDWDLAPCLSFARLLDEGITCACEGDVNSLLSMLLLSTASGGPAIMGNVRVLPPQTPKAGLRLAIEHCILPLSMTDSAGYILRDHHGHGRGVTGYALIRTGVPATVVQMDDALSRISIFDGNILEGGEGTCCRIGLRIAIEHPSRPPLELMHRHASLVLGRWAEPISVTATELGLRTQELSG